MVEKRAEILTEWRLPFVVKPLYRRVGQNLANGDGGHYLVYPNLLKGEELITAPYTETMVNYHGTSYSYYILVRQGLMKLGDVLTAIDWLDTPFFHDGTELSLAAWLMISMIGLFVLKVGDVQFANVLVDINKRTIHVIDYDDSSEGIASGETFYLKTTPAKDKLVKWLGLVRPYYPRVISFLGRFVSDPIYGNRFQSVIDCFQETPMAPGGSMQYRGLFFGSTTFSGCPIDEVKSQLQKSIRRNEVPLALLSAFELYRFSEIEGGSGIVTNLYNRLAVIAAEDIGPANLGLVVEVLRLIGGEIRNKDPNVLGAIVQLMCLSPKTRVGSHLWRVYVNEQGRGHALSMGLKVNDIVSPEDQLIIDSSVSRINDPSNLVILAVIFKRRLMARSFDAMIWLAYFIKASEGKKVTARVIRPRRRQTDPMMLIWEVLKELLAPLAWEMLIDTYLVITENRPFLMVAIASVLYGIEYTPFSIGPQVAEWEKMGATVPYLNGVYHLTIQPEAIDKHTKRGRREGKDRETFVTDGAIVSPEDPRFIVPVFQEIYRM